MVLSEHSLTALCTSSLHYAAPQELQWTTKPVGTWSWEGAHCSDRFDFKQYRFYESDALTSEPSGLLLATQTTTSWSRALNSEKYYTVFADYSARAQSGVTEGTSDGLEVGCYQYGGTRT